jgi:nitrate/nitrite transporter NarK
MTAVLADVVGRHWRQVVLCILVVSGATISQYFFIYTTTYALTTLHYSQAIAMAANLTGSAVGTVAAVAGGVLADRFGLKPVTLVPRLVATLLLFPAFELVLWTNSPAVYLVAVGVLMIPHAMSSAAGIILIPRIFPAAIRTAGLSIAYALGVTLFGGTAQIVFTWIIASTGNKLSWLWYIIVMSTVSFCATLAIRVPPETAPQAAPSRVEVS